jgi:hypothetical protein
MVHKEIWAHLLAYNLLRTVMAVAAAESGIEPRHVSFLRNSSRPGGVVAAGAAGKMLGPIIGMGILI